ncbi:hypothetical protein Cfor_10402, partial [Coptotermes formosanus]
ELWHSVISVTGAIKGVNAALQISATCPLVVIWPSHHAYPTPNVDFHVTNVTDISEVECFNNHKILRPAGSRLTVCESRRCCASCGATVTNSKHECHKPYCKNSLTGR